MKMEPLTIFILKRCPYCKKAIKIIEKLQSESKYEGIELVYIDESKEKELAASFDYYYVPSFFVGNTKLHEGAIKQEQMIELFDQYMSLKQEDV